MFSWLKRKPKKRGPIYYYENGACYVDFDELLQSEKFKEVMEQLSKYDKNMNRIED